jgi:polyisoprenoid-binding protein YceI
MKITMIEIEGLARDRYRGSALDKLPKEQGPVLPSFNLKIHLPLGSKPMRALLNSLLILFLGIGAPLTIGQTGTTPVGPDPAGRVSIEHGTAIFSVTTTMPGVTVKGKSESLHANVRLHQEPSGLILEHVEAWLPAKTLGTGISLRDEHMRKYIFATPAGEVPDLRFEGKNISCPGVMAGHEANCNVSGTLSIRGTPRNFSITLKIREANGALAFRIGGEGLVRLSDYGIEPPSTFGVKTANEIQVHLEIPETSVTQSEASVAQKGAQ